MTKYSLSNSDMYDQSPYSLTFLLFEKFIRIRVLFISWLIFTILRI